MGKTSRLGGNICQKKSLTKHPDQKYVQKLFKKSNWFNGSQKCWAQPHTPEIPALGRRGKRIKSLRSSSTM